MPLTVGCPNLLKIQVSHSERIKPGYVFGAFVVVVSVLACFVYRDYLGLGKLFLYKDVGDDTLNSFFPRLVHLSGYLRTEGFPRWSFSRGMGQSILPNSLGSPFDWPLLILGAERLAYGIAYIETLKVILGGMVFYRYLRLVTPNEIVCFAGGLIYAFSGYMIVGSTSYIYSTEAVYLALFLFAFEYYLQKGVWWPFPLVVALIASYAFTIDLYTHAVFLAFYGPLRYLDRYGWKPKEMFRFALKATELAVLGAGLAGIFLIANIQEMLQSGRGSGKSTMSGILHGQPLSLVDGTNGFVYLMRMFSNNIIGIGDGYHGLINYNEDPLFYCGLITLLLVPQVFQFLSIRQKAVYGTAITIVILPFMFPYLRYAFWLFSGDYYRILGLFAVLLLVIIALRALENIMATGRVNSLLLLGTVGALLLALFYPHDVSRIDQTPKWVAAGFLCAYTVLVMGLRRERTRMGSAVLLLFALAVELTMTATMSVNGRPVVTGAEFHQRTGYNDYSIDAIEYLKKTDQGFYRVEKTYSSTAAEHGSLNDGMVQGYWGTSSYASFNKDSYLDFMDAVGLVSDLDNLSGRRWMKGLVDRPVLSSFASVKYVLAKDSQSFSGAGLQEIFHLGDIRVEKNLFALPFGFTYGRYMMRYEFDRLSIWQKDLALIKAVMVDPGFEYQVGKFLQPVTAADMPENFNEFQFKADIQARQEGCLDIASFSNNRITGNIKLEQPRMLFFSIPFDRGWQVKVDGKPSELLRVNIGFTGVMLSSGSHRIELEYQPPYWYLGWSISAFSLLVYVACLWRRRSNRNLGALDIGTS